MVGTGHKAKRLIIHMGVQKTASTAFHHFVQKNRDALPARLDILTPEKKSPTRALGRAAAEFSLDASKQADFVARIEELRDLIGAGEGTCILSHENLPGAMPGRQGVTELFPNLPQILSLLDRHFAPFQPEYVFYIREMNAWKHSVYNQAVKSDACAWTLDEFIEETEHCGSWEEMQRLVTDQLGEERVTFFRLEDEAEENRPGTQLLRMAGMSEDEIAALMPLHRRPNQSLNAGALEFMRLLNVAELPPRLRKPVVDLVMRNQPLFVRQREGA